MKSFPIALPLAQGQFSVIEAMEIQLDRAISNGPEGRKENFGGPGTDRHIPPLYKDPLRQNWADIFQRFFF